MQKKIILLVEDNPDDVALTRRAFKKSNLANELVIVRDGGEALDYIFARGEHEGRDPDHLPQLVLLDLNLPKISGIEVLSTIRQHPATRSLPVVILSTSDESSDLNRCYELGCNSYITKPVDLHQFMDAIHHLGLYWLVINTPPFKR